MSVATRNCFLEWLEGMRGWQEVGSHCTRWHRMWARVGETV